MEEKCIVLKIKLSLTRNCEVARFHNAGKMKGAITTWGPLITRPTGDQIVLTPSGEHTQHWCKFLEKWTKCFTRRLFLLSLYLRALNYFFLLNKVNMNLNIMSIKEIWYQLTITRWKVYTSQQIIVSRQIMLRR